MLEGGGGGGATGLLNKGGGSNRLPGLVNNKLWNFHRYRLVYIIMLWHSITIYFVYLLYVLNISFINITLLTYCPVDCKVVSETVMIK